MPHATGTRRRVILRDLLIFQAKLWLDNLKDLIFVQISIGAAILDLLSGPRRRGRFLYSVLRLGERWDLWLNLYGAARGAEASGDGLFGASPAGAPTLVGKLEAMVRENENTATGPIPTRPTRMAAR